MAKKHQIATFPITNDNGLKNTKVKCPFPPHNFENTLRCIHVMFIYKGLKLTSETLDLCTSQVLQLLTSKTVVKNYTSISSVNSNYIVTITILVSFKGRAIINKPENFLFFDIAPSIHHCTRKSYALRFLVENFNKIHPYTDKLLSTDPSTQEYPDYYFV
jgi:hypothetical protein